ncbi:uncharacterized protein BX664DRAFT_338545 [Halteromyces radiatus]|uniref:uncharacterized protein n=1 Tax=Halteromyces radiatus TaxID=101107 RepID=UPI00221F9E07|nr:uncharacterized protein BX664DRAFT_338545 [Halteromyces radiatus]KAI8085112.1 hypothetical protein BX664DRAFT_338545 [Halteromyces radiatus]
MPHYIHSFSSPTMKGWLLQKSRIGLRKTRIRYYFILESQQLRSYKTDRPDALPISSIDLSEYELQIQPSAKQFTFQLIHQTSKSSANTTSTFFPSINLDLQAENELDWSHWVDTLEHHVGDQVNNVAGNNDHHRHQDQVNVLDKWLGRYDLIVPSTDRCTPSLLSLAPSSSYDNNDDLDDLNPISPRTPVFDQQQHQEHQQQQQQQSSSVKSASSTITTNTTTKPRRFFSFLSSFTSKKNKSATSSSTKASSPVSSCNR